MPNRHEHLWIPDGEVVNLPYEPQGRDKDMGLEPAEHGSKLSLGLQNILSTFERIRSNDSLGADDIMVFKVLLPEGQKIDNAMRQKFLEGEGLKINAVKDSRQVIVSTKKSMFERLTNRVNTYKNSGRLKNFQYIEGFEPYTSEEKQAATLRKHLIELGENIQIDIQMMLLPKMDHISQEKAVGTLMKKIIQLEGKVIDEAYELSDGTAVIRAMMPMNMVSIIADDLAIYRVEETRFFSDLDTSGFNPFKEVLKRNSNVDVNGLPIVAILDTGIKFPPELEDLVIEHWAPKGVIMGSGDHGTKVASKVVFGNLGYQLASKVFTPRARVIDCCVLDGKVPENVMIKRLQDAVERYKDIASIFNFSANADKPIDGDEISITGYELDNLMLKYGVQFVISAGNHYVWRTASTLDDILDDDDTQIASPGDSMLGITVGSIVGVDHGGSISNTNMIAPYSRKGPGFAGLRKPDLVAYGATLLPGGRVARDQYSVLIGPNGIFCDDAGTSFTAPDVSGALADILSIVPNKDVLLAKALLYHGAQPVWDNNKITSEEATYIANLYGRGLVNPDISKFSSDNRVTFVRTGELNKKTKQIVKFHMPSILENIKGRNIVRVAVTCVTKPPVDKSKGENYLSAYIEASLHKIDTKGKKPSANPSIKEGRMKWDTCYHFEKIFSNFSAGDWEVWLVLHTRWEIDEEMNIPYGLAVTVEELSGKIDIYTEIRNEVAGRFMPLSNVRIPISF